MHELAYFRFFSVESTISFQTISALLRLGHKYRLDIEKEATTRLKLVFPSTLEEFDDPNKGLRLLGRQPDTEMYCSTSHIKICVSDAIAAINLARTYDIPSILPSSFYMCSRLPLSTLVSGALETRGTANRLSSADLTICLEGHLELIRRYSLMVQTVWDEIGRDGCTTPGACFDLKEVVGGPGIRESDPMSPAEMLGHCLVGTAWVTQEDEILPMCKECSVRRTGLWVQFRKEIWDDLPSIFNLL